MSLIRSMTGYGTATLDADGIHGSVTMRSVNHRYLDLAMHLPPRLQPLEQDVKRLVQDRIRRGRVEVFLQATVQGDEAFVQVARPVISALVGTLRDLQREHRLSGEVTIADVVRFPGAVVVTEPQAADLDDRRRQALLATVDRALAGLEAMRAAEGARLETDLRAALDAIEAAAARIAAASDAGKAARREALVARMATLREELGGDLARFQPEVVRLVERYDIEEELQRLASHVSQARGLLSTGGSCGKQLDFLAQEFAREANTIGSKASVAAVVQEVVALKGEIERLREQVQNVE
jgi:uncharacterized protein (TIGR00255 family)